MIGIDLLTNIAASIIYDKSKSFFQSRRKNVSFDTKSVSHGLNSHLQEVINWSSELRHKGMSAKTTDEHYIHLKYYSTPRREQFENIIEDSRHIDLKYHFEHTNRNTIVLGQPGAGKTTSSKYIAHKIIHDENFCQHRYKFPVVIRFSELRNFSKEHRTREDLTDWQGAEINNFYQGNKSIQYEGIFQKLFSIFGLNGLNELTEKDKPFLENLIIELLDENQIFLILEGFDEYPFDEHKSLVEEIRKLSLSLSRSGFLLTSRTVEFPYTIENSDKFEIAPLEDEQIKKFAESWLRDSVKAEMFFKQLLASTYLDTARRPLTLSHLLTIFDKSNPPTIPRKPNAIYSKVVELFIREWDEERNIVRKSTYSKFQAERKKAFLCKLSFYLTKKYFGTTFTGQQLRVQYLDLCESFDLKKEESYTVLKELESHNGLFLKSGADKYEFAHKSIQEYFTSEYLIRLPKLSNNYIQLHKVPNELAILVALATEPNDYFKDIINICINEQFSAEFISAFVNRINLENPDFTLSPELAETVLSLFTYANAITTSHEEKKKAIEQISNLIFCNSTFGHSIAQLERFYSLDPKVGVTLINATTSGKPTDITLENVVTITRKDSGKDEFLNCKLKYLSEWIYIRPYYDMCIKHLSEK